VALGLAVGVGALIGSLFITPLSMYVLERLGYSTESNVQQELLRGVQGWVAESPGTAIPAAVFVIVVFAPAVEEIIFRGALFGGLFKLGTFLSERLARGKNVGGKGGGRLLPFVVAALLSSAFFALLHLEPVALPTILVLAMALCALYWKTGSLVSTFVAHATFNSFAVLVIVLMGSGVLPTQA
jgi:membrane protease YdiL (CAAX protease family)